MQKSNSKIESDLGTRGATGIKTHSLTKEFEVDEGTEVVFEDVNINIEPGSFVSLVGRSGSGKSTLLNILSGILEPTSGRIEYDVDDPEIGHVFQSPRLLPWDTCLENIEYVHEDNSNYSDDIAKKHLDMVGLSDHYDKYPSGLSGGQKQRVGIARAFSIDPEVLLMDEPFSNLDEITAEELRKELAELWENFNKTIVFVTHNITEAIQLSDRILMIGEGEIYADIEVPIDRPRRVEDNEFIEFQTKAIKQFRSVDE